LVLVKKGLSQEVLAQFENHLTIPMSPLIRVLI
jgi:hypothetical protein